MARSNFKIKGLLLIVIWAATIFFATIYIRRQELPYENGRYFDPKSETVIHEQSIIALSILTIAFLMTSLIFTYKFFLRQKMKK